MQGIILRLGFLGMNTSNVSSKLKKILTIDRDYLLVALLFIIVIFSSKAFAFSVTAPESVVVGDNTSFFIDITNTSEKTADLKVNFYAPISVGVIAPRTIAPNQTIQAKITLSNNKFTKNTQINSTLEVTLDQEAQKKEIALTFSEGQTSSNSLSAAFAGLFSFTDFSLEIEKFSLIEWVAFWVFIFVAAVLLIAFVARLSNRV